MSSIDFGYLIEAPWQPPHYIGIRKLPMAEFFWTKDHEEALRFSRPQDAQKVLDLLSEPDCPGSALVRGPGPAPSVVMHSWIGGIHA